MGKAYIKNLEVQGSPYVYCDIVTMGGGSPPERPHPGPGPGPGGPGGPVDPGYSPPWAQIPVDPGYSPPWAQVPGPGPSPGPGQSATIIPLPPQDPPVPPPAGMAQGAVQVVVWMGPGTKPTTGWINPYADQSLPGGTTPPEATVV